MPSGDTFVGSEPLSLQGNPTVRALIDIHRSARGFRFALVGSLTLFFGSIGGYIFYVVLAIANPTNSAYMLGLRYTQDLILPGIGAMALTFVLGRAYTKSRLRSQGLPHPELAPIVAFSATGRTMMTRLRGRDALGKRRAMSDDSEADIRSMVTRASRDNRPGIALYIPIYIEAGVVVPLLIYMDIVSPSWWSTALFNFILIGSVIAVFLAEVQLTRIRRKTELAAR
jgi:hypothetical protein